MTGLHTHSLFVDDDKAEFRRKLHSSFPRFVAYCAIRRSCRPIWQLRAFRQVVLGLVVPEGTEPDVYEDAARYAAHGPAITRYRGLEDTEVLTQRYERRYLAPEITKALAKRQRVILVAGDQRCIQETFRLAADAVLEIGPIHPRHVIAGAKLCLGLRVSEEQAEYIATVPLEIITASLRRGRSVSVAIAMMKKAVAATCAKQKSQEASGPSLSDLHGLGEAGGWGHELALDLSDWREGKIGWRDVDRGILLSGPPGTGKTTFAGALAKTCGVHLVLGSIGRWQAKGHLGDLLMAMRDAFDEARENAPSILFLDEIDAVGDRERFSGHNAQYCTEVVAALLECLDGLEGREGVVVVGACNYPDRLDAALTRPGRLDRHVRIPLPDAEGREGILRWHLAGSLSTTDLSEIVGRTDGWSGAALEQIVRQARRSARRARRDLCATDLLHALPPRVALPEPVRRRAAIHEAGHVVVALALCSGEVLSVSVEESAPADPQRPQEGGGVVTRNDAYPERTRDHVLDSIATLLGGLAAEEVVLGQRSAGGGGSKGSDLHTATISALMFEASWGLGASFTYLASNDEEELFTALRFDRLLQSRVEKILQEQFQRAKRIIEERRADVETLSGVLLQAGSLSGEEVKVLLKQHAPSPENFL